MRAALKLLACSLALGIVLSAAPAMGSPVCTDGYKGGPPRAACGGRVFPEAALARSYIQYEPDPTGFREYQHGIEYLAQLYPRWISVFTLREKYGSQAVSAGPDRVRPHEPNDAGDGRDIFVVKITDHDVPDARKKSLMFSLAVHGNERGGLEGGVRTAEDLAIAAENGGYIADGVAGYKSTTGRDPVIHQYPVKDVLAKEVVYLIDYNVDGWAVGDVWAKPAPGLYTRGNSMGTDLNRQMPTVGRINSSRNPLQESEMLYGHKLMHDVAAASPGGLMAHGADLHGELQSQAYVDLMYPAGQFDSIDHRRLMAIAERTKSVIDETLYAGVINEIEEMTGGDGSEYPRAVPVKPAHWGTVWDTLGYTDTGFIGDYFATDVAVTGMDYEFFLNHTVPDKAWNVYMQENHINGTRAVIKTAMAYSLFQEEEFNEDNVTIDTGGRAGYVFNPVTVTDKDANGPGTRPGPSRNGIGQDGKPVAQASYDVTNMRWFEDTSPLLSSPFRRFTSNQIATDAAVLDQVDSLVLADIAVPKDPSGAPVDAAAYYANLKSWVERGGNLVLTDRAIHALGPMGVLAPAAVTDIKVYQPHSDISDFSHPMVAGLRANARQLVEAAVLGYGIGNSASPMTVVTTSEWQAAGGQVVGTTTSTTQTSLGEMALGAGKIRIVGGALPTPSESQDHRYGLRDYALTYSGLYIMENSLKHDAQSLGASGSLLWGMLFGR